MEAGTVRPMAGMVASLGGLRHKAALVGTFVRRDIQGRYKGSAMGLFWSVIHPLIMLFLFTFVFSVIMKIKVGTDEGTKSFALYLLCGMLPWNAFQEGLSRSTGVILENAGLIKRTVFPSEILPVYLVLSGIVNELIGLSILLIALLVTAHPLSPLLLLLPAIFVLQFLFTVGLSWMLAGLNVFIRDVGQMIGLILTLWVFLTPIYYPPSLLPEGLRFLLVLNPMAGLVDAYRALILRGQMPNSNSLMVLALCSILAFAGGYVMFRKMQRAFADVI
jgi:lipopolysaccharide transport system permease protein